MGFHCVDCVEAAARATPTQRTVFGGVAPADARPLITYTLLGICAVAYALQLVSPDVTDRGQFAAYLGAREPWRFLTAAFLHAPGMPLHILFNMVCLWQIGTWLEPLLGRAQFTMLYLVSAVGGSVGLLLLANPPASVAEAHASIWFTATVGASGAVFGLFGAVVVLLRYLGRSVSGMVALLAINAALPLLYPNIAWQAHLGGFVTGVLLAGVLVATREQGRRRWQWPAFAVVIALVVMAAVAKYTLVDTTFIDSVMP